MSVSGNRSC